MQQLLEKYFQIGRGHDNLPILVKSLKGQDGGRRQLARMMNECGFRSGIEIGTAYGESAVMCCEEMPGLNLTCIDPYLGRRERAYASAQKHAEKCGFSLWKMKGMDAVDRFEDGSVDFVHIDGDHTFDAVVQDIVRYVPKVRKGGMVLIHDYFPFHQAGVMQAVNAYTHCHRIDPWYVTHTADIVVFWERGAERC
jgi:predicted O-methyltransferase YrrM